MSNELLISMMGRWMKQRASQADGKAARKQRLSEQAIQGTGLYNRLIAKRDVFQADADALHAEARKWKRKAERGL